MIKAIVTGAAGRMGKTISKLIEDNNAILLAGGTEHENSDFLNRDIGDLAGIGPIGKLIIPDLREAVVTFGCDAIIDFTTPDATMRHLSVAVELKKAMVIGTTGIEKHQEAEILKASEQIPIVFAPNMSVGINLMLRLICEAASVLGEEYDIEVVEAHHRHKKDAPSGTAMKIAEVLAQATEKNLQDVGVFSRKGMIGERKRGEIGIQTLRGGDIVGDHTVLFAGIGERIEITHRASSRETFAGGAVKAAIWLNDKGPGLYSMQNVLGFS